MPNYLRLKWTATKMARKQPAVELLRARVRAFLAAEGHGSKVRFGKAVGMRPSSVTAFIRPNNPTNVEIDKIDAIARHLGCSVADLFTDTPVTLPDTPDRVDSRHTTQPGESTYGIETRLLREQLAERERTIYKLTKAIEGGCKAFAAMADEARQQLHHSVSTKSRPRRAH